MSVFTNPSALWLLLLIPLMGIFLFWREHQRLRRLRRLGDEGLINQLNWQFSPQKRRFKSLLWISAYGMLILALARPVWGIDTDFVDVEGIAITVVLDVSNSMDARDVTPSRLERARLAARNLFEGGTGNQVALILFAGNAFVQFPLTTDTSAALTFLNGVSTESISRQGTALEEALELAIETIDDRLISQSLIVVMTDGENHEGNPIRAAEIAAERGIVIHTIGYGDPEGAPIPELNEQNEIVGYKADQAGNVVVSRLEEETLMEIADITGGTYQRATASGIEIINLLNIVQDIERGFLESRTQVRRVERFPLFVGIALLLIAWDMLLSERKQEALS